MNDLRGRVAERVLSSGVTRTILATVVLVALAQHVGAGVAFASYSCNSNGVHCYSEDRWNGPVIGSGTTIENVTHLGQGDVHLNTEQWLVAPAPSGACYVNNVASMCWVEIGIKAGLTQCNNIECFFFNDVTPANGYTQHWEITVPAGDYGNPVTLGIKQASSSSFNWSITDVYYCYTGVSSNNTMVMNVSNDQIQTGAELQGTTGAVLPPTAFWDNGYYAGGSGSWVYEGADGSPTATGPLIFGWVTRPSQSPTGGDFDVSCPYNGSGYPCG
jgi:hypothetical protein